MPSNERSIRHQTDQQLDKWARTDYKHRVGIVGGGIAAFACAHVLLREPQIDVTLFERSDQLGGRANRIGSAEHCQRLFLEDYEVLLELLAEIPSHGETVRSRLVEVRRFSRTVTQGWVEIDHPYSIFARQISFVEKCRILLESRRSVLASQQVRGSSTNILGHQKNNYSLTSKLSIARNLLRRQKAFQLPCDTHSELIQPWEQYLAGKGLKVHTATKVGEVRPTSEGAVEIVAESGSEVFDAAVIAAFHPDVVELLSASGLENSLTAMQYAQCPCYTIYFAASERSPRVALPALYSADGIGITVQPEANRCVVLCVRSVRVDERWVLERVADALELTEEPVEVYARANDLGHEGLYIGDLVDPSAILPDEARAPIYFAGSWTKSGYPVDAGEAAAKSGSAAAAAVLHRLSCHEESP